MTNAAKTDVNYASILIAIDNFKKMTSRKLALNSKSKNRVNSVGDSLEMFVVDLFCSSLEEDSVERKKVIHSQLLSYLGNQNNPPDFMIRGGDAVEVKKFGKLALTIPLNSSAPKSKLYCDDKKITKHCVSAEDWSVKDIIYIIGIVADDSIENLFMIYGDCFAASREVYQKIEDKIRKTIDSDYTAKELGAVKKVDPLGITNLRVRGMWRIKSPYYIFKSFLEKDAILHSLMKKEKFLSFSEYDRNKIKNIKFVQIQNPGNPAQLIDAVYIWENK
jgi:hypothetical protein